MPEMVGWFQYIKEFVLNYVPTPLIAVSLGALGICVWRTVTGRK